MDILDQHYFRIAMLFGRGRITAPVDDSGSVQIVQVQMSGLEVADERYRVPEFGFTSNPPIGSDVLALHVAGDRTAGAVVATNHQPSRPTGLQPGETMLYSQDGKHVYITSSGGIVVEAKGQDVAVNNARNVVWNCSGDFTLKLGGKFNVVAPGGTNFDTPTLDSTGDITDQTGSGNAESMSLMRTKYNEHDHVVEEVQTGGSNVTSNTPLPQM
jgi:phage baseplate assembly protein V